MAEGPYHATVTGPLQPHDRSSSSGSPCPPPAQALGSSSRPTPRGTPVPSVFCPYSLLRAHPTRQGPGFASPTCSLVQVTVFPVPLECAAPLAPRPHGHTRPLSLGCSQDAPPPGPPRISPRPLGVLLLPVLCASPSQQSQETRTPRAQDGARCAEAMGACLPRAVRRLSARPSQRPPRGLRVHERCRSGGGGQWSPDWDGEGGRPHLEALPLIITGSPLIGCTPRHGPQRHSLEAPFHHLWDCGCF